MRLDQIKLRNFRCFRESQFEFDPKLNLIIGANGGGKSSLLAAVRAALTDAVKLLSGDYMVTSILNWDARFTTEIVNGRVRFESNYPVRVEARGEVLGERVEWFDQREGGAESPAPSISLYQLITPRMKSIDYAAPFTLPIVAFYWPQRNQRTQEVSLQKAVTERPSRSSGYGMWSDAFVDRSQLTEWVMGKTLEELQVIADGLANHRDEELKIVNRAVGGSIPNAVGLRYDLRLRTLVVEFSDKSSFPFATLSDGQQSVIALIADIARRMCLLNPQLGADVLSQTDGIIAIDELDLHLHPRWQRDILALLARSFPRVQFFITAHSPQMISELLAGQVLILRDGKALRSETTYGLDSSSILEEIMGASARPASVEDELSSLFKSIELGDLERARKTLDHLKSSAPGLPDYSRIEALIRRKEILGR